MLRVIVLALSLCLAVNGLSTGGWSSASVSEVEELARWSTKQMASMSGFEGEYTIQSPKNVQRQVVSGVNYKFQLDVVHRDVNGRFTMKTCDLFIYEQAWTNTRRFVQAPVCNVNPTLMAGGWTPVTEVTENIVEVARLTAKQMNAQLGFEGEHLLNKVYNVQKQLVAGMNYKYTAEYIVSSQGKQFVKVCEMHINHQAWINKVTFLSAPVCRGQERAQRDLNGGWTPVTEITENIVEMARLTAKQLNAQLGFEGEHLVKKVSDVSRQLVNGMNYKYTVEYLVNGQTKVCQMHVNHQAWTNKVTFLSAPVCRGQERDQTGGWSEQTQVTDEILNLARWSTSQLSQFTGVNGEHTVMTVRNIKTQVVAGMNYKFTLDVLVNDATTGKYTFKSCDMFIYVRSWDNVKSFAESPKCSAHPNFQ